MPMPSVAPDYSRFERRQTVVEPEVPLEIVEEAPKPTIIMERTRLPYKALITFAFTAALLTAVIFSYNRMWSINAENMRLEHAIQSLQMEEQALLQESGGELTLHQVNQEARNRLEMLPPAPDQIVYVNLSGYDHAVVYTREGLLQRVWSWIAGLF